MCWGEWDFFCLLSWTRNPEGNKLVLMAESPHIYTSVHYNDIDLDKWEPEDVFCQDLDHCDLTDFQIV